MGPEGLYPLKSRDTSTGVGGLPLCSGMSDFPAEPKGRTDSWGEGLALLKDCLTSCRLHTFPHLPSQEKDFNNELLRDNRPLINSLLFFWGWITLIKMGWGGGG